MHCWAAVNALFSADSRQRYHGSTGASTRAFAANSPACGHSHAAHASSWQEEDVEVRKEDQLKINTFGRLNNRKHDLEEELKEKQAKHDLLDDAANEIILADDDEPIRCAATPWRPSRLALRVLCPAEACGNDARPCRDRYGFGECYFECSKDQAEELLEQQKTEAEGEIAALQAEIKGIMDTLAGLKTQLCAAHRDPCRGRAALYAPHPALLPSAGTGDLVATSISRRRRPSHDEPPSPLEVRCV